MSDLGNIHLNLTFDARVVANRSIGSILESIHLREDGTVEVEGNHPLRPALVGTWRREPSSKVDER